MLKLRICMLMNKHLSIDFPKPLKFIIYFYFWLSLFLTLIKIDLLFQPKYLKRFEIQQFICKKKKERKKKKFTQSKWSVYKVKTLDFWVIKVLYLKTALMEISSTQAMQNAYTLLVTRLKRKSFLANSSTIVTYINFYKYGICCISPKA